MATPFLSVSIIDGPVIAVPATFATALSVYFVAASGRYVATFSETAFLLSLDRAFVSARRSNVVERERDGQTLERSRSRVRAVRLALDRERERRY